MKQHLSFQRMLNDWATRGVKPSLVTANELAGNGAVRVPRVNLEGPVQPHDFAGIKRWQNELVAHLRETKQIGMALSDWGSIETATTTLITAANLSPGGIKPPPLSHDRRLKNERARKVAFKARKKAQMAQESSEVPEPRNLGAMAPQMVEKC